MKSIKERTVTKINLNKFKHTEDKLWACCSVNAWNNETSALSGVINKTVEHIVSHRTTFPKNNQLIISPISQRQIRLEHIQIYLSFW